MTYNSNVTTNHRIMLQCHLCQQSVALYLYRPDGGCLGDAATIDAFMHDHLTICRARFPGLAGAQTFQLVEAYGGAHAQEAE